MENSEMKSVEYPVHEYRTMIRERHLDSFGHVNNAQYLVLFEEARWEMITSRGYGLSAVKKHEVGTVVLECTVRFKRELGLREEVVIRTKVEEIAKKTLILKHWIVKEGGAIAAEASFTLGCFDLKHRKLIPLSAEWLQAVSGRPPL
ncbi:MAG: acyl-CoA thioesterase [Bdellovibrionales bacterium]|nr:acyl-CoA thioesterase [Bdellovibrionales bacterium]